MLALSANLERELKKATVEPVVYLSLALSTTRVFCNQLALGDTTADPVLDTVTVSSQSFDPIVRETQLSQIEVRLTDDGTLRSLVSSEVIISKDATVSLGTTSTAIADQQVFFRGPVLAVFFEAGGITIRIGALPSAIKDYQCLRTFFSKHPFDVLAQLLDDCGVTSGFRDTTSFTPATYANNFGHYTYSSLNNMRRISDNQEESGDWNFTPALTAHGVAQEGYNGSAWHATFMVNALGFLNETMMVTECVTFVDGNGKLKIKHFRSTDSAARHFTADDYTDFEQVPGSGALYNYAKIGLGQSPKSDYIIFKDTASIAIYGQQDWNTDIVYNTACADFLLGADHISISVDGIGKGAGIDGFAGTKDILTSQAADEKVSSAQPWYGLWREEVIKATTRHVSNGRCGTRSRDIDGQLGDMVYTSGNISLDGFATRPFAGSAQSDDQQLAGMFDITAVYNFGTSLINRFSHGAPQIKITLGLDHLDLELGDLVTLDNDLFASAELGLDGLDSDVKFEITGKDVTPIGDSIGIRLELTYATKASPPTVVHQLKLPGSFAKRANRHGVGIAADVRSVGDDAVNDGLECSAGTGLELEISAGSASRGGMSTILTDTNILELTANKDSYINIEPTSGSFSFEEVSTGAAEPPLLPGQVRLAKVVCGSSITSVGDLRILGSVGPEQVNRTAMQPSESKVWNGDFEHWPSSLYMCPNWNIVTGTFGTNFSRDDATVYQGAYSLKMENPSSSTPQFRSDYFKLSGGKPLEVSVWAQGATGLPPNKFGIYFFQKDKSAASTSNVDVHNGALASTGVWYNLQGVVEVPSNAAYGQLRMNCTGSPTGKLYYDNAFVRQAEPSFQVYGAATTAPGTKGVFQVKFNNESHDYGGNYDHSGSDYDFEAPSSGLYEFNSKIEGVYVGSFSYLLLMIYKNGSVLKSNYGTNRTVGSLVGFASVSTGPVQLSKGDLITVQMHPEIQTSYTLSTGAHQTYFSGRRLR